MPTALPPEASPPGTEKLPPREALGAIAQAAQQVAAWHDRGLVHLAIDRAALTLSAQGIVHLAAPEGERVLGGTEAPAGLPPEYAGPLPLVLPVETGAARAALEAAGCQLDPRRIDVYQLGELLCSLVTGEPIERYLQSPKVKGGVPRAVSEVVDQALGFDPARRYRSASELAAAIDRALAQDALASHKSSASDTSPSLAGGPRQSDTSTGMVAKAAPATGDLPFTRLGQYEIVARLGSGGMGDVYQGYDADLDRYVAIKVLPAELARSSDFVIRFRSEAAAAAKVEHPNIVPIYTIGSDQGHHFFAMQYVAGQSLAQALAQDPKLPRETTLAIVEQVVSGLAAAHRHGLVHRDIKPGNILLAEEGRRALLADFGLVKSVAEQSRMTATGVIMGTVDYLSPEQGRGKAVDGRSDLYSIGVLLYQMLAGRLPFMADSPTAMIFQHAYEPPPPLALAAPEVPPGLAAVVHRLLAKSPDERHASCEELLEDLRALRAGQTPPHAPRGAAGRQATAIIIAPQFGDEPPAPDIEPASTAGWSWSNLYQHALLWLGRQAPEVVRRLQNTQQQVDGAVFEYQQRCDSLARLVGEAEEVQRLLSEQLRAHQEAADQAQQRLTDGSAATQVIELATAERHANQRAAQELQTQLAQQQDELDSMRLELAKSRTKLTRLQSQRDALNARLKVAQARYGLADGRPRRRPWFHSRWAAIAGGMAILAVATFVVWYVSQNKASTALKEDQPSTNSTDSGSPGFKVIDLLRDSTGHTATFPEEISCIEPLPLGNEETLTVVAGGKDGSLFNFFPRPGAMAPPQVGQCRAHGQQLTQLTWNQPTRRFASASRNGEVIVWNWGNTIFRRVQGEAPLSFSLDGGQLFTGKVCWDVVSGNELERYVAKGEVVWLPDGPYFVNGLSLMAADNSRRIALQGPESQIHFAALGGGSRVIGVRVYGKATVWNTEDGSRQVEFGDKLTCASYSRWQTRALLGDDDGGVSLWDITSGSKIVDAAEMAGPVSAVAISPRGDLGMAASGKTLQFFPLPPEVVPNLRLSRNMPMAHAPATSLVYSLDSNSVIASGVQEAWQTNLDEANGGVRPLDGAAPASSLAISPDGRRLVVARPNPDRQGFGPILLRLAFLNARSGDPVLRRFRGHRGGTTAAHFVKNGTRIVSGGNDNHLRVWETVTEEEVENVDVGTAVRALAVTPQGNRAFVVGNAVACDVWDLNLKQRLGSLEGHSLAIQAVIHARDASRLVTVSGDRTARVWDAETLQPLASFEHPAEVVTAVIAHDGNWIVTGSRDGSLRFWNVTTKSPGPVIWAHPGPVTALALAPDGRTIVSAGEDLMLNWWDVPSVK